MNIWCLHYVTYECCHVAVNVLINLITDSCIAFGYRHGSGARTHGQAQSRMATQ